jgi:hypothetical protein
MIGSMLLVLFGKTVVAIQFSQRAELAVSRPTAKLYQLIKDPLSIKRSHGDGRGLVGSDKRRDNCLFSAILERCPLYPRIEEVGVKS